MFDVPMNRRAARAAAPAVEPLERRRLLSAALQWQPLGEPGSGGRIDAIAVSPHDPSRVLLAGDILGSALTTDGGRTWGPTTGFQAWEHSAFTFHPTDRNVVWAATASGPHRSADGGATWAPRRAGLPASTGYGYPAAVEKILFDAGDPARNTLLAFGGDHRQFKDGTNPDQVPNYGKVWRSQDGGATWAEHGAIPTGLAGAAGNNVVAATYGAGSHEVVWAAVAESGVWRSTDDGGAGTWQRRSDGLPALGNGVRVTAVAASPTDPLVAFATVGTRQGNPANRARVGGVFRTSDAGLSWQRVEDGDSAGYWPPDFLHVAVAADGRTVWASDANWGDGMGLYKSADGGSTWSQALSQSNLAARLRDGNPFDAGVVGAWWVEVDPSDADVVYAGSSESVLKTSDGGATWEDAVNTPLGGGAFRGNGFAGWVATNAEYSPFDSRVMVAQGFDRLLAGVSRDGGYGWATSQPGLPRFNGGNDVAFAPDGTVYAALGQGSTTAVKFARSGDGGATWAALPNPGGTAGRGDAVHVSRDDPDEVWAVTDGGLYRSTNARSAGPTWQKLDVDGRSVRGLEPVGGAAPGTGNDFYLQTDGGTYFTDDAGFSVTPIGGPSERVKLSADPSGGPTLWAASNGHWRDHGLYRRSGGAWSAVPLPGGADYWAKDVAVDPTDPLRVAVVTNQDPYLDASRATGVWLTADGGATWSNQSANLPVLRGNTITFSPDGRRLIVGTGGRGFFAADVGRSTLGQQAEHLATGGPGSGSAARAFAVGSSPSAEGGRHLSVPNGGGNNWSATADAATASFTFTLDQLLAGARFRGRVQTPGGTDDDSFFVQVDGGPWLTWDTPLEPTGWAWGTVRDRGASADHAVDLAAGRHVVRFKHREDGARLDAVEVVGPAPTPAVAPRPPRPAARLLPLSAPPLVPWASPPGAATFPTIPTSDLVGQIDLAAAL